MDSGEPESDYLKDMLKMREEFKKLPHHEKERLKERIEELKAFARGYLALTIDNHRISKMLEYIDKQDIGVREKMLLSLVTAED